MGTIPTHYTKAQGSYMYSVRVGIIPTQYSQKRREVRMCGAYTYTIQSEKPWLLCVGTIPTQRSHGYYVWELFLHNTVRKVTRFVCVGTIPTQYSQKSNGYCVWELFLHNSQKSHKVRMCRNYSYATQLEKSQGSYV